MNRASIRQCRHVLFQHGKSFALAGRLLGTDTFDDAAVVYAWCRRVDDDVDRAPRGEDVVALDRSREELHEVYSPRELDDPVLDAFRDVVRRHRIPRDYPEELLEGMKMDVEGVQYDTLSDLLLYCFRVAGTVGLMMCHVLGLQDSAARRNATHLGMAMQLTNICRDVEEDWRRGRLYIPRELLPEAAAFAPVCGDAVPDELVLPMARAVRLLLAEADRYYGSGDDGVRALSWRAGLAVRAARSVYAAIGRRIADQQHDVTRGRAFVPLSQKLALTSRAVVDSVGDLPLRWGHTFRPVSLHTVVRYPADVLPV